MILNEDCKDLGFQECYVRKPPCTRWALLDRYFVTCVTLLCYDKDTFLMRCCRSISHLPKAGCLFPMHTLASLGHRFLLHKILPKVGLVNFYLLLFKVCNHQRVKPFKIFDFFKTLIIPCLAWVFMHKIFTC